MGAITKNRKNIEGFDTPTRSMVPTGPAGEDLLTHVDAGNVLPLVGATASANGPDQLNGGQRGIRVVVDITAIAGTAPTLVVSVRGKDATSGKYFPAVMMQSAVLNAVGTYVLTMYPGLTPVANQVVSDVLPRLYRVEAVIGGGTPNITATIGAVQLN